MTTLSTSDLKDLHERLENSLKSAKSAGRPTIQIGADLLMQLTGALASLSERVDALDSGVKSEKSDGQILPHMRGVKSESTWDSMPCFAGR